MAYSTRTIGIISASTLSLGLIVTAYVFSGPLPFHTKVADAQSTHELLVSYASKDTDSDGLPDWEEALYGTDPSNAHSVNPSQTDGEAVAQGLVKAKFATATSTPVDGSSLRATNAAPTTLTDQFAKSLFGQYLKGRGNSQTPPTSAEIATFVEQGVQQLKKDQSTQDAFNLGQVRVSGTGPDAMLAYAANVEKVFSQIKLTADRSELEYFSDAITKNDTKGLVTVGKYGDAYAQMGRALMKLSVPKEVTLAHLAFANALMHLSDSTLDLAALNSDPLRAMLGMAQYQEDAAAVARSLKDISAVFIADHAAPSEGSAGFEFYSSTVSAASATK